MKYNLLFALVIGIVTGYGVTNLPSVQHAESELTASKLINDQSQLIEGQFYDAKVAMVKTALGMCDVKAHQNIVSNPRDYQLDIHMDTMRLYDGNRLVGTIIDSTWDNPLQRLIEADNY